MTLGLIASVAIAVVAASPVRAQWTRDIGLPAADVYSLRVFGDTLVAGVDQAVWVSTNGGASWRRSADLPAPLTSVECAIFAGGRLWCGTYGQGIYASADLGATWQPRNTGLSGGLFDSHLYVLDLEVRGDSLFAATDGAGAFASRISTTSAWSPFGTELLGQVAGSVSDLQARGDRLVATAGSNGAVFHNDRGETDWTLSYLDNVGIVAGLLPRRVVWTGASFLVSTQAGCFRSADGESPWTAVGPALGPRTDGLVTAAGARAFVAMNSLAATTYAFSPNEGSTWQTLESVAGYTYAISVRGATLLAARTDGLWRRDIATLDAPTSAADSPAPLRLAGAHPLRGARATMVFGARADGRARWEVFDPGGRRVCAEELAVRAGENFVTLDLTGLPPGVYHARLVADGLVQRARLVRLAR